MLKILTKAIQSILIFAAMCFFMFALVEGLASTALLAYDIAFNAIILPTNRHIQHDPLLGWTNTPDVRIDDMYGPSIWLQTNSEGIRSTQEFTREIPAGKFRIMCSGDSFTFGVGVNNDQAWCARLETHNQSFETLNYGESGHGIGQAYLKYSRDGSRHDHDVLIFAFIPDDFRRVGMERFIGSNKPRMELRDGELVAAKTPVPESGWLRPWYTYNANMFNRVRAIQLGQKLLTPTAAAAPAGTVTRADEHALILAMFDELRRLAAERGATLVLAFLPENSLEWTRGDEWGRVIGEFAAQNEIIFLDLYHDFYKLSFENRRAMIGNKWKHYSVEGNDYAADSISTTLRNIQTSRITE
jgi:hypothetical protein